MLRSSVVEITSCVFTKIIIIIIIIVFSSMERVMNFYLGSKDCFSFLRICMTSFNLEFTKYAQS